MGSDFSWRKHLVESLELKKGDKVLDLATGTADVAIMLGRSGTSINVIGIDPSSNM